MPSLKEVRTRIASVDSTQQITSAMKMVAASKLRRAQAAIVNMRPYAHKLNEILQNVSTSLEQGEDNIFGEERTLDKVLIIAITSNRGLCGAFNANIIKQTLSLMENDFKELHKAGKVEVMTIGKKATDYFSKKGYRHVGAYDEFYNKLTFETINPLAEELLSKFEKKEYDKIVIVYNQFKNAATQILASEQLLPIVQNEQEAGESNSNYRFEPSKEEILGSLVPAILKVQFIKLY